eukprot:11215500-Lingulodinium_polyedra.AAC.1
MRANGCGRTVGLTQVVVTRRLWRGFRPTARSGLHIFCGAHMGAWVVLAPTRACVLRIGRRIGVSSP